MSSQGPNNGSTFVDDSGTGTEAWNYPERAQYHDANPTYATLSNIFVHSHYLKATGFGFSIPSGAIVNGIKVEVERYSSNSNEIKDDYAKIVKEGTIQGNNNKSAAYWPTTPTYQTYGGASDLWGLTFSTAQINSSDFGFVISCGNMLRATDTQIDHITISVYYTVTGYTLSAGEGTYQETGQNAGLRQAHKLTPASGSYALTGQTVALRAIRKIPAAEGSLTITGQFAALKAARRVAAAPDSYALTVQTVALKAGRRIAADPDSYALTGQTVALRAIRKIPAAEGSLTITGQFAALKAARRVAAAPDSYTIAGQTVNLKTARKIPADPGSYSLTGQAAVLRAIRRIAAGQASYFLAGQDAALILGHHYTLLCEAGYYGEPYSKIFLTLDGRIYKKMGDVYLRLQ